MNATRRIIAGATLAVALTGRNQESRYLRCYEKYFDIDNDALIHYTEKLAHSVCGEKPDAPSYERVSGLYGQCMAWQRDVEAKAIQRFMETRSPMLREAAEQRKKKEEQQKKLEKQEKRLERLLEKFSK